METEQNCKVAFTGIGWICTNCCDHNILRDWLWLIHTDILYIQYACKETHEEESVCFPWAFCGNVDHSHQSEECLWFACSNFILSVSCTVGLELVWSWLCLGLYIHCICFMETLCSKEVGSTRKACLMLRQQFHKGDLQMLLALRLQVVVVSRFTNDCHLQIADKWESCMGLKSVWINETSKLTGKEQSSCCKS